MNYFTTFFTHSGAIKFSRFLTKSGMANVSSPVPRKLSSNCGIGIIFSYTYDINKIYIKDIEKIYFIDCNEYSLYKDFDD